MTGGAGPKPEKFSCRIYGVLLAPGSPAQGGSSVLLARSRFKDREFVNFPGGGIELGEAPMAALKREFEEETGVSITPVRVLYASEAAHLSTQMPIQIVSVYWLVERERGNLREAGNGDDVVSVFWAPLNAVPTGEMFPSELEFVGRLPGLL
jgi:8-oxo-dGTP pyrophosphatase MutT (NUDIX family)